MTRHSSDVISRGSGLQTYTTHDLYRISSDLKIMDHISVFVSTNLSFIKRVRPPVENFMNTIILSQVLVVLYVKCLFQINVCLDVLFT